jgi:uncharacterized membrane protein YcaP (DUF421 family)
MESVLKAFVIYFALWALLRITGRRTMGELSAFDLILFLVIGGATQRALVGQDYSLTTALVIVSTLVAIDVALSLIKREWSLVSRIIEGAPMVVVDNGKPLAARLRRARITIEDVLQAARQTHGLERIEQVKFAILEANGDISIIPRSSATAAGWNPVAANP